MHQTKKLDSAIRKGSFMIFPEIWRTLKALRDPEAVGKALYMACDDCWSEEKDKEFGNGFLFIPEHKSIEVDAETPALTIAAHSIIMQSNISARKKYLKNNPTISKTLNT